MGRKPKWKTIPCLNPACTETFKIPATGSKRAYHSQACKQQAYRNRLKAQRLAATNPKRRNKKELPF
jgi:hypothetical protein